MLNNQYVEHVVYFLVGLLGVIAHFLKRKVKGQTAHDIKSWFSSNLKDTLLTFIIFIGSYAALAQAGEASFYTAFLCGYAADSIFDRKEIDN